MNKQNAIIVLLLTVLVGCSSKKNEDDTTVTNSSVYASDALKDKHSMDSLLDASILKGDTSAYNKLYFYYTLSHRESELLPYTMIMANKYKYAEANYYVYLTLTQLKYGVTYEELDETTKRLATYHLLKANELGCPNTENIVRNIYKEKRPPAADSIWIIKN